MLWRILRGLNRSTHQLNGHSRKFTWPEKKFHRSKGLFGNPLLDTPEAFVELNRRVRKASMELIDRIETGSSDRITVKLFDDLSNEICCAADLAECTRQMHTDPQIRKAAEESAHDFCDLVESINTRKSLYEKIATARDDERAKMNAVDLRTLDLFIDDFKQSGVHLPDSERQKFVHLSTEIFLAGAKYQDLCDRPVQISNAERSRYGLSSNTISSPISHFHDFEKRKFIYTTFMRHNPQQEQNLCLLIGKRHELATLTGYETYAERAQYNTILGSSDEVQGFLEGLIDKLRPEVDEELRILKEERVKLDCASRDDTAIGVHELPYLSASHKNAVFGPDYHRRLSSYFTAGNVMSSFESITRSLYQIRFEYEEIDAGEVWPGVVFKIRVKDEQNNDLGLIYVDIENRSSKAIGDCHYTVRCSKELADGTWQLPIVVLSLSFTNQKWPSWREVPLTVSQAENLYHEMGHAMHSMLGKTKYQHVAGTRCPQDMAEIPSNLMEHFFFDPAVMSTLLENQNAKISINALKTLAAARSTFSGIELAQQASCALVDLELHGIKAKEIAAGALSSTQLTHKISSWAIPGIIYPEDYAWQHRFHHLVQYGARYYSYLVARSAASLIYNQLFSGKEINYENGKKWAEAQSHGGGIHPLEILKESLGYRVTTAALIDAIYTDVRNRRFM